MITTDQLAKFGATAYATLTFTTGSAADTVQGSATLPRACSWTSTAGSRPAKCATGSTSIRSTSATPPA